jgi:carbon storage regulator
MLYITRRIGETVVVNNDIEITVLEVIGKKVKLGCKFPKDSTVFRKELHDKISSENFSAIAEVEGSYGSTLPEPNSLFKKMTKE